MFIYDSNNYGAIRGTINSVAVTFVVIDVSSTHMRSNRDKTRAYTLRITPPKMANIQTILPLVNGSIFTSLYI